MLDLKCVFAPTQNLKKDQLQARQTCVPNKKYPAEKAPQ